MFVATLMPTEMLIVILTQEMEELDTQIYKGLLVKLPLMY